MCFDGSQNQLRLVFVTETECVYYAVRTYYLNIIGFNVCL